MFNIDLSFKKLSLDLIIKILIARGSVLLGPLCFAGMDLHATITDSNFWSEISMIFIGANLLKLGIDNFLLNKSAIKTFNVFNVLIFSFIILLVGAILFLTMYFLLPALSTLSWVGIVVLSLLYLFGAFLRVHDKQATACLLDPNILFWALLGDRFFGSSVITIDDFIFYAGFYLSCFSIFFAIKYEWSRVDYRNDLRSCRMTLSKYLSVMLWLYPVSVSNWIVGIGSVWVFNLIIPKEFQSSFFVLYRLLQSSRLLPTLGNFSVAPAISRLSEVNEKLSVYDLNRFAQFKKVALFFTGLIGVVVISAVIFLGLGRFFLIFFVAAIIIEIWLIPNSYIINVIISFGRYVELLLLNTVFIGFIAIATFFCSWQTVMILFLTASAFRFLILRNVASRFFKI